MRLPAFLKKNVFYIAFAQALIAILGSLYFSEILKLPPCLLCWYQRIAMYPIALIAGLAIWHDDKRADRYILPFAYIGFIISIYHNLLYYHVLPESIQPCTLGVSCTSRFIELGGIITIPLLSMLGFIVIILSMLVYRREQNEAAHHRA